MATNELFQQHVTCPVCLDIFDDPHSLECRHIVCLPCLNRLKDRGRVECPECREQMPFKRIKRDFKTKKLADSYKNEKQAESGYGIPDRQPKGCEVCKLIGEAVVSRCITCDTYLCQSCELAHKGVRATKNHVLESKVYTMVALQVKAGDTIRKSMEDLAKVEISRSDISKSIAMVNSLKYSKQLYLKLHINGLIKQVEDYHVKLKNDLTRDYDHTLETFTQNLKVFDKHKTLLEDNIGRLRQLKNSNDLQSLMAPTATVTRHLSEQSKDIDDDLCRLDCNIRNMNNVSSEVVVSGHDLNVSSYITVKNRNTSYADLMKMICVEEERVEQLHISNMCMINDELWCCGGDKIRIFNEELNLEREISHDELKSTKGLTEVPNHKTFFYSNVIVACGGCGLHQLNSEGEYVCKISNGNYSDVRYYNKFLYALCDDGDFNKVYVFEKGNSNWVKKLEWCAVHSLEVFEERKMFVNTLGVFLLSFTDKRIHQFSHKGKLIQRAGRAGEDEELVAGMLKNPVLCGVDSHGIALVGDNDKQIFQLYNCNDCTWQIIIDKLTDLKHPLASVLNGNDLFISTESHLLKYKLV